jgi:2-aminoadipate transaminase
MTDTSGRFDHLFADAVRASMDEAGYGSWRSISAPDAVSLSFGFPFPDSFPNEELVDSAEGLFEAEGDVALQYGGGDYADALADMVVERANARGIDCTADEVMLANGSTHAIDVVCHTFFEQGDGLFVEAPTFMGALSVFRNYGVDIRGFDVDDDGLDVDAVEAALADGASPKMLYTIPNFQNPSGTTMPRERRERLLELAAEYDFLVLEDDAYGALRYDGEDVPPLRALDDDGRVVRVGTFSKTIAPGIRTGWVVADEEIIEQTERIGAGGSNVFTRGLLARYYEEGHFETNVEELVTAYERRRDHMLELLETHMPPEADWTEPDGGFFVWAELPEGVDTDEMLADAAEEGVVYLPGHLFYADGRGDNCMRLSFSHVSFEEMERGIEALGTVSRRAVDGLAREQ